MDSTSLELTLYTRPPYVPKTIANFFNDLSRIKNDSERLSKIHEFIDKHEQEMCKMEGLKCELPQCVLLIEDAIESLKEEAIEMKQRMKSDQPQWPIMDFLSLKRNLDEEQMTFLEKDSKKGKNLVGSSPQVWSPNYDKKQKTRIAEPCKINNREEAFVPLEGCSSNPMVSSKETAKEGGEKVAERPAGESCHSPTIETPWTDLGLGESKSKGNNTSIEPKQSQLQTTWKNSRRSWSPELHDSFMHAMELLGGSEVATPKHIRELMQVDGLTNDQVKSHLQKYRLHSKQSSTSNANSANQPAI